MKITVIRTHGTKGFTHGQLHIDGVYFCDTMEDQERDIKIDGETAIPCGQYKVIINMSARFNRLMPLLLNVPNYTGVRIHSGNTSANTDGCLLVGKPYKNDFITASKETFAALFKTMNDAIADKQEITLEVI